MATFFGGETLVGQTLVSFSGSTSGTKYTVPAGRYAIVMIQAASSSGTGSGSVSVGATSIGNGQSWYGNELPSEVALQSGQTISSTHNSGNTGSGTMFVREFNNP